MHKGEDLDVTPQMIFKGMEFLVENKMDTVAAFGLLRLAF